MLTEKLSMAILSVKRDPLEIENLQYKKTAASVLSSLFMRTTGNMRFLYFSNL